jgi:hypothetical protein
MAATLSLLDLAVTQKEKIKFNFYRFNKEAISKGETEAPFAHLIPLHQHDPNSATEMLDRLQINGIRIYRLIHSVNYQGVTYPTGTYIIPLSQPCRPCIKDLMEKQAYPNVKRYPGGPPRRPYDYSGWTLPLQMGVRTIEVTEALPIQMREVTSYPFETPGPISAEAEAFLIESRYNNTYSLVNQLFNEKITVERTNEPLTVHGKTFPKGTFIIPNQPGLHQILHTQSQSLAVPVYNLADYSQLSHHRCQPPRIGLYQSWLANRDEGWTRWVLDKYTFPYSILHNSHIKKGKLIKKYDVIIMPSLSSSRIIQGRTRGPRGAIIGTPELPAPYQGGIGPQGIRELMAFIKAGGTLITLGSACEFAIEELRLPLVNTLSNMDRNTFYCPGSLLEVDLDLNHPLTYGMPNSAIIRLSGNIAFRLLPYHRESHAVAFFPEENPLQSGWLIGSEYLEGKTALAEIPVEKGRVVLFGLGVQNRGQTFGTFKLLFNAILGSRMAVDESVN